jgi:glycine/D-amino acid oxidase-like deaminating enzyme
MPKMNAYDMLVVGAGIFGVTTALELKARGYRIAVLDPGPPAASPGCFY